MEVGMFFVYGVYGAFCKVYDSDDKSFSDVKKEVLDKLRAIGVNFQFDENVVATTPADEYINSLFSEYVPLEGAAETVLGEIIRAVTRIIYRFYNDGDYIGVGYGRETVNPSFRYLTSVIESLLSSLELDYIKEDFSNFDEYSESKYIDFLNSLSFYVSVYIVENKDELANAKADMTINDYKNQDFDYDDSFDDEEDEEDDDDWYDID